MNEWNVGDVAVYAYPENGYAFDQSLAADCLVVNKKYTVSHIETRPWKTYLYFDEVDPSFGFNSILFKNAGKVTGVPLVS